MWKYTLSSWTNFIYLGSAYVQYAQENYLLSIAMVFLAVASFRFHYLEAEWHYVQDNNLWEDWWDLYPAMKFWQKMDVAGVYTVLCLYPHAITGQTEWLLLGVVGLIMTLIKFDILFPYWSGPSAIVVPILGAIVYTLAFIYLPLDNVLASLSFLALAGFQVWMGRRFYNSKKYKNYDKAHGPWHVYSGVSFMFIY